MTDEEEQFIRAFNATARAANRTAREKGWWDDPRSPGECIALMHSELSEALEAVRRPGPDRHCPEFDGQAVELADVIIRIMDYAAHEQIPVARAVVEKMRVNATRERRHGGALL